MRFIRIYIAFFKQQIKELIEYKVDFLLGIISLAAFQISTFLLLFAAFTQIDTIAGYSFNEILLFYGYSQLLRGIDHLYNDNIWQVGWGKVKDGSFSNYLIRPINVLTHIVIEKVQFDGLGEIIIGLALFIYAKQQLELVFSTSDIVILIIFMMTGLLIYFSVKIMTAAIAFWAVESGELMSVIYEINLFTKYPMDIYKSGVLRFALTYIFPFAIVSYYPIVYYIRDESLISTVLGFNYYHKELLVLFVVAVSLLFSVASYAVWSLGLKRYNATGT